MRWNLAWESLRASQDHSMSYSENFWMKTFSHKDDVQAFARDFTVEFFSVLLSVSWQKFTEALSTNIRIFVYYAQYKIESDCRKSLAHDPNTLTMTCPFATGKIFANDPVLVHQDTQNLHNLWHFGIQLTSGIDRRGGVISSQPRAATTTSIASDTHRHCAAAGPIDWHRCIYFMPKGRCSPPRGQTCMPSTAGGCGRSLS